MKSVLCVLACVMLLGACAATPPGAAEPLTCRLASNCVSSQGTGGMAPLAYGGTPTQALARLQATAATFPEATVVRTEALSLALVFVTPAGFRDEVDFRIDAAAQRIDFRSRSTFGLYDFGKNRSRMAEFALRFGQQQP